MHEIKPTPGRGIKKLLKIFSGLLLLLTMGACTSARSQLMSAEESHGLGDVLLADLSDGTDQTPALKGKDEKSSEREVGRETLPKRRVQTPIERPETHEKGEQAKGRRIEKIKDRSLDDRTIMGRDKRSGPKQHVALDFDNADIYKVIKTISEMLEINYVIDPAVKGTVNIHARGRISKEDLFDILMSLLKVNGAAILKEGDLYHVVPTQSAKTGLLIPNRSQEEGAALRQDEIVLQLVRLQFISVAEAAKILRPFMTPGAELTLYEKNNLLLITEFAANLEKLLKIVDLLDVNLFEKARVKLYPMQEADVEAVSQEMQKIFSALEISSKSGRGLGVHFIPIKRMNSLLVITSLTQAFQEVEKWLAELDRKGETNDQRTFIYHVKNGIADELADILNSIFSGGKRREHPATRAVSLEGMTTKPGTKEGKKKGVKKPERKKAGKESSKEAAPLQGSESEEIRIIPYTTTNTIIINATLPEYREILEILKELDIIQRQVLIDILIAELTLNDETSFGIQSVIRGQRGVRSTLLGSSLGLSQPGILASGGLTASIINGDFRAVLNALASENRVAVLASPHIIASDGKEASIDIGDEVPLVSSKIFIDQREEITIERRNTGVILKVNPHINTTGLVTLDISLELSDATKAVIEGESDIRIFKRNANTSMVVQDGETIIIGGLIDTKKEEGVSKVPLLGDIPILGYLFRSTKVASKKTELVLVITPHVIRDVHEASDVTDGFMGRLSSLRNLLQEAEVE